MDLTKVIAALRAECNSIDQAIQVLTQLAAGDKRGRGRHPEWHTGSTKSRPTGGDAKRGMSADARKAASDRAKKYTRRKVKQKGKAKEVAATA